ncbi:MAG TPA: 1-deoxy-D-xylulose-5-phosphate reductoisomerase [Tenuifilaceae bacterium]|nr:1-deoxy-D-xylulose-5-phosphate reductoisomerase [Bacteroidales bacterium]HNT42014.1 1-deoxy-D-xylulose-5-phosphate reductoisomerase [Tenuifilaceae bacterium]MBP8644439.1 1-deoxy-D-xylulose-5-phosphate reductoisomerase [Bacteroidales bacterium]HNY09138.1 1-deoxy-D-xylulose-5-phosphate reductoisomerase [Tenuifilaceae bacterium]HOC37485.1 1-deoxy-D-xylulose-5-phosphate reductoisomerase [Tenuifilaceae bacterium]
MKNVAILGSTGSIGTQALQVIESNPELFSVELLTAQNNWKLLVSQALKYQPNAVVIGNDKYYVNVKSALEKTDIKIFAGKNSIADCVGSAQVDMVLVALVGFAGLEPTISAIKAGKTIALANKETLVVAGELISELAMEHKASVLPVDSEHSAIFQSIVGERSPIEKIILTASGGPFRNFSLEQLGRVTPSDALQHPNWCMGNKITVDSASLMNKGLEVIEARWLFNLKPSQIEVVVHPQSIVHSMVQFEDGSVKAQLGLPDMRIPIQYALTYPFRVKSDFPRINFGNNLQLTFERPDTVRFPNLALAREALERGGNMPCVLNAANEVAVEGFLEQSIGFMQMSEIIAEVMSKSSYIAYPSLDDYKMTDIETRLKTAELISQNLA